MGGAYGITYAIPNRSAAPVAVTSTTAGETATIDATLSDTDGPAA